MKKLFIFVFPAITICLLVSSCVNPIKPNLDAAGNTINSTVNNTEAGIFNAHTGPNIK